MCLGQLQNLFAELIRHEPERELRHRMARDHRLRPLPLITAADAVDLGSRTRPEPFQRAVAFLAEEPGRTGLTEDFLVAIDRQFPPSLALPILQRLHRVVE